MVALVRTGRSVESLAREYEPCAATIHEWVRQAVADDGDDSSDLTSAEREELRQLRRKVKPLRHPRIRTARPPDVQNQGRGKDFLLRVHRGRVQFLSPALGFGV